MPTNESVPIEPLPLIEAGEVQQLVFDLAVSQIDKNDAHEVIILTRFFIAVQQMLFFQLIAFDSVFSLWSFHTNPNGIDLLDFIVVAMAEFGSGAFARNKMSKTMLPSVMLLSSFCAPLIFGVSCRSKAWRTAFVFIVQGACQLFLYVLYYLFIHRPHFLGFIVSDFNFIVQLGINSRCRHCLE